MQFTANNPELFYLKAQIQSEQGRKQNNKLMLQEAVKNFDQAIAKKTQLPASLVKQIERERHRTAEHLGVAKQ